MIPAEWMEQARQRLRGLVKVTPLTEDDRMGWFLKWENQQLTGSFKLRGALNKVLTLSPEEQATGLVCASAGNHGQGVALAGQRVGAKVIVFASEQAVPSKISAMRKMGAEVHLVKGGYAAAEEAGKEYARQNNHTWISPYNDVQVICGQATLGYEILEQLDSKKIDEIYIPVGGGGLAAGLGAVFKMLAPNVKVIGVQSEASPYFQALFHFGSQDDVVESESLADGLAGAVEKGAITIPLVRQVLDDLLLVSEAEIKRAVAYAWQQYGEQIEGSAGVALAAARKFSKKNQTAVVLLSGGNIQAETHAQLLAQYSGESL